MDIGLGLPITDPALLLDWARRADRGPFRSLGLLDRLVHPNPEPLVTLAVLAGATERIRLQTEVLLAPLREPTLLATQAATLDVLSAGRFSLGIGVGIRDDDYRAAGVDPRRRGALLDAQLPVLRRLWAGEPYSAEVGPIGPAPVTPGGPELLIGGFRPAALARVAAWGDGFLCGAPPTWAGGLFDTVRTSWRDAGRAGDPRLVGQVNVAFGPETTVAAARAALRSYYGSGDWPDRLIAGLPTTATAIRDALSAFADLGADEVVLYCWAADPEQVDRLADLVG